MRPLSTNARGRVSAGFLLMALLSTTITCTTPQAGGITDDPATRTLNRDDKADEGADKEAPKTIWQAPPADPATLAPAPEQDPAPAKPVKEDLPYTRIIDPSRQVPGSMSMGTSADGFLMRHASLPIEGQHHAVLPNCRERHTNYGTEELVELLLHTAAEVSQHHPGPRLMMGNMSVAGGGDIKWSRSHNSGRDADIAFYVLDPDGNPVDAPALLRFNDELKSGQYTFDVPRNWAAVKALMNHPTVQVQWLFIATYLRDALLEHAVAQNEDPTLIENARKLLWQPTDSSPHADHLHLRIYCSEGDLLEGCLNTGPVWDWIDTYESSFNARVASLVKGLVDPDERIRAQVLEYMKRIEARSAAVDVAKLALYDKKADNRLAALELLATWRAKDPTIYTNLEAFIRGPGGGIAKDDPDFTIQTVAQEGPPEPAPPREIDTMAGPLPQSPAADPHTADPLRNAAQLRKAYDTLRRLGHHNAVGLLMQALTSQRRIGDQPGGKGVHERTLAARASRNIMALRLVPVLIDALDTPDQDAREAVALVLRRITNHTFKVKWERPMKDKKRKASVEKWRRWWKDNKKRSRTQMLLRGFKKAGIKIDNLNSHRSINKLVKAVGRNDHIGYNAARVVAARCGRWHGLSDRDAKVRAKRWKRWWKKNQRRLKRRWARKK